MRATVIVSKLRTPKTKYTEEQEELWSSFHTSSVLGCSYICFSRRLQRQAAEIQAPNSAMRLPCLDWGVRRALTALPLCRSRRSREVQADLSDLYPAPHPQKSKITIKQALLLVVLICITFTSLNSTSIPETGFPSASDRTRTTSGRLSRVETVPRWRSPLTSSYDTIVTHRCFSVCFFCVTSWYLAPVQLKAGENPTRLLARSKTV